jgi:hypothetical protein
MELIRSSGERVTPIKKLPEEVKYVLGGTICPYITCLKCNKTSYYAEDIRNKYCGYCKEFHEEYKGETFEMGDCDGANVGG